MTRRSWSTEDLYEIRVPGDPRMSPDGETVALTLRIADPGSGKSQVHLWVLAPGAEPRQLTDGPYKDTSPRFSPDGRTLAFLTNRGQPASGAERAQLAIVPVAGGPIRILADEAAHLASPAWSPDGRMLVFAMRRLDRPMKGESKPAAIRVTTLRYKANGVGYLPRDRFHLYAVDLEGGAPRALTVGDRDDSEPAFSPDGGQVVFLSNRGVEADLDPENLDVWCVPAAGGEARQVSRQRGGAWAPGFTPDGTRIAFFQMPGPKGNFLRDNAHPFVVAADGSAPEVDLTPDLDRCALNLTMSDTVGIDMLASPPAFSADGQRLLFLVSDRGRTLIASASLSGPGPVERLLDDRTVSALNQYRGGGPIALLVTTHTDPGSIAVVDASGRAPRTLWDPNAALSACRTTRAPEEIWVTPEGGVPIQAFLLRPDGPGPHPLLLSIHGGPVFQYGDGFFHELQMLAGRGFAVLYGNPRGSQGYGRAFVKSIHRDWGTLPMIDLMALTDHVLARGGFDADRLGVFGGSYGGYMTLWIIGHTGRFRAACAQRTVANMEAMIWSDFGGYLGDWLDGFPWEDPELYHRLSPLTYAKDIHTPLLITQGLEDHRTPADQGERTFVYLKRMGRPVEMVLFPGADHDLSRKGRPEQRVARLDAIAEFLERHLGRREPAGEDEEKPDANGEAPILEDERLGQLIALPGGDMLVERLAMGFLEGAGADVAKVQAAFAAGSKSETRQAAHALRGACLNLGVARIAWMCEQIEKHAREGVLADAGPLVERLTEELERARTALTALSRPG